MSTLRERPRVGELRPSQILTTFGIGSIVDLPHLSVMIMGLEDWPSTDYREINEERLLASVRNALGKQVVSLRTPPVIPETDRSNPFEEQSYVGVPVAPFPRWMVCPRCRRLAPLASNQFVLKADLFRPDRVRYVHENCRVPGKLPTVIPARFVVACKNGHLDDFPWVEFVHRGPTKCSYKLQMLEMGVSGEAADVYVRCETCETSRPMSDAFSFQNNDLPFCRGRRPHLRDFDENGCPGEDNRPLRVRALLQGASNSWFPLMLSVLSVPQSADLLKQLVTDFWSDLYDIESEGEIAKLRRRNLLREFSEYSGGDLWAAIEDKKNEGKETEDKEHIDLKTPEWDVFTDPDHAQRTKDFRLKEVEPPKQYSKYLDKIVLAERLREVRALIGFTRIESPGDYENPAEFPENQRMAISRAKPNWVPANEIRGEGIFFQFNEDEIYDWTVRVPELDMQFFEAHKSWRKARGIPDPEEHYPGVRFVLLHSFAHALIRQLSLECGYTAASLRERIYSRNPVGSIPSMAGVLIYTAAPDSEGTLGGLVSLGKPEVLARHLSQALDSMRLCSSDPLCAEHHAGKEGTTLHGASCHACLFAPETSCERGNKYLDRSVLIPTVDQTAYAFFDSQDSYDTNPTKDKKAKKSKADSEKDDGVVDYFNLIETELAESSTKIQLPNDVWKSLKLKSAIVNFRFLKKDDGMPEKNSIVIIKHDGLVVGTKNVKLACGKILWSKQKDMEGGKATVLVSIRANETAKLRLSVEEWDSFRPLAVINE
jgi:MrfA Zn-binding domain